jgi:hypothetical protein
MAPQQPSWKQEARGETIQEPETKPAEVTPEAPGDAAQGETPSGETPSGENK